MKPMTALTALIIIGSFHGAAVCAASERDIIDTQRGTICYPATDIIDMTDKFKSLKASKRDTVKPHLSMAVKVKDGGALPTRLFFQDGDVETDFTMTPTGNITDFDRVGDMAKTGNLCLQDKSRITADNESKGDHVFELSMDMNIIYKNTSGVHSLSEIKDGLKDGKSHINKLVPAPVRLIMPKFDHMGVVYLDENQEPIQMTPQIFARSDDGNDVSLESEFYDDMYVVSLDALEAAGGQYLVIKGHDYVLTPMPSVKKMKKFEGPRKGEAEEGGKHKD